MTVRDKSLDDWSAWTRPQQAEIDRLRAGNAQLRVCELVGILILAVLCFVGGAALGLWLA